MIGEALRLRRVDPRSPNIAAYTTYPQLIPRDLVLVHEDLGTLLILAQVKSYVCATVGGRVLWFTREYVERLRAGEYSPSSRATML